MELYFVFCRMAGERCYFWMKQCFSCEQRLLEVELLDAGMSTDGNNTDKNRVTAMVVPRNVALYSSHRDVVDQDESDDKHT